MVYLGARIVLTDDMTDFLQWAALWVLPVLGYLVVGVIVVRRGRRLPVTEPPPARAVRWGMLDDPRLHVAFSTTASLVGITAGLFVVASRDLVDSEQALEVKAISLIVVILSWLMLHTGYAGFYRGMVATKDPGALVFPECPWPGPVEFAYFSFTVGVTFATSDVEVVSRRMRWHILVHSILSFVFNTAVIAIVVNVVSN